MIKVPDILKKFGEQVAVEAGLAVTRGFLNDKIKDITPSDMYTAIQTNQDLWEVTPNDMRGGGLKMKQRFGKYLEKYQKEVNVDIILEWLQKDHPDLYSTVLNTPNGVIYLSNQLEKIKYKVLREL